MSPWPRAAFAAFVIGLATWLALDNSSPATRAQTAIRLGIAKGAVGGLSPEEQRYLT